MELLAHSGRRKQGLLSQAYADHVRTVRNFALARMQACLLFRTTPEPAFEIAADWAALFHDLGKLDASNQQVLRSSERGALPVNHVDAGTAHLCAKRQVEAAIATYGHHRGLCDLTKEKTKERLALQDAAQAPFRDYEIKLATDAGLPDLLALHRLAFPKDPCSAPSFGRPLSGLDRRLLLSCLVDADHSDTARHYKQEQERYPAATNWAERLAALDVYVRRLGEKGGPRATLRSEIYHACRSASPGYPIWACDAPVGSGKTCSVMAYLIQAAIAHKLRHIIVVLPYTNIIRQSVDEYRRALVLPGEDAEKVVVAHHHQVEFRSADLRYLTTLWDAPIIVTTAVQFFETLGSNQTVRLRKLHQLPGSAVFIDEAHAAMPIHLWPFMWNQLKILAQDWSCRFVLGSGSLAKFWENPRIFGDRTESIPFMIPDELRLAGSTFERNRVRYQSHPDALTLTGLCDWVQQCSGPRLVVLNTVQSAAVVARELRRRKIETQHISTALAPIHREAILETVRTNLKERPNLDWVLVATSCVEAGVDFSFASAFRERCRAASLVQIGGRVNRHGERSEGLVWDFIVNDPMLTQHPDFKHSRDVVAEMFQKQMWDWDLTSLMSYALEQEFKRYSAEDKIADLIQQEGLGCYPQVAKLSRLINADTRLVVVDPHLIQTIRQNELVDFRALLRSSVQLWSTRIEKLALSPIGHRSELYAWEYPYDPAFLGIMDGILQQTEINSDGFSII